MMLRNACSRRPRRPSRRCCTLVLLACALPWGGCLPTTPVRTGLLAQAENVRASENEVWTRLDAYVATYVLAVGATADRIRADSTDALSRRRALLWKIQSSDAILLSSSHPDALIAVLDTWALQYQLRDSLTTGEGKELFAEYQPLVLDTVERLRSEFDRMVCAGTVSGDAPQARAYAESFAREHPMGADMVRSSTLSELVAEIPVERLGPMASMGNLTRGVETLSGRVGLYAVVLPKIARWQAELTLEAPRYEGLLAETQLTLRDARARLDEIMAIVDNSPILDQRFEATLGSIVEAALRRVEVLIEGQRTALEQQVDAQRVATIDFVHQEREEVLRAVQADLDTLTQRVDALAARTISDSSSAAERLIDRAYARGLRLLLILLGGALALMLAHRLLYRRGQAALPAS